MECSQGTSMLHCQTCSAVGWKSRAKERWLGFSYRLGIVQFSLSMTHSWPWKCVHKCVHHLQGDLSSPPYVAFLLSAKLFQGWEHLLSSKWWATGQLCAERACVAQQWGKNTLYCEDLLLVKHLWFSLGICRCLLPSEPRDIYSASFSNRTKASWQTKRLWNIRRTKI